MKLNNLFEGKRMSTLIKGKDSGNDYPELIYTVQELKDLLKKHYGKSDITIENVAKLYAEHDYKLRDNILEYEFPVKELDKYKEWTRTRDNSNMTPEEWDEFKESIKKHGIKDYGIIGLYKRRNGDVIISMNEGNHRLAVAKELGIRKMKMRFYFGTE